mmetsp:Transcript_13588/g.31862  ORF Transcript_13588/g.31862 Transcript_13588/m.31862 type:complete len:302 (+) Transcript_13588:572-1477(+)
MPGQARLPDGGHEPDEVQAHHRGGLHEAPERPREQGHRGLSRDRHGDQRVRLLGRRLQALPRPPPDRLQALQASGDRGRRRRRRGGTRRRRRRGGGRRGGEGGRRDGGGGGGGGSGARPLLLQLPGGGGGGGGGTRPGARSRSLLLQLPRRGRTRSGAVLLQLPRRGGNPGTRRGRSRRGGSRRGGGGCTHASPQGQRRLPHLLRDDPAVLHVSLPPQLEQSRSGRSSASNAKTRTRTTTTTTGGGGSSSSDDIHHDDDGSETASPRSFDRSIDRSNEGVKERKKKKNRSHNIIEHTRHNS